MRSTGTFKQENGAAQLFTAGAAPKYLYSGALLTAKARIGSVSCKVAATAKTDNLAISATWQVSDDGSTYYDLVESNNPANVALITGTGTSATVTKILSAPNLEGFKFARVKLTTATGAADGTDDGATLSLRYVKD